MVKCIENKIALYSPHTSFDAIVDGVNDWLISPFGKIFFLGGGGRGGGAVKSPRIPFFRIFKGSICIPRCGSRNLNARHAGQHTAQLSIS